MNRKDRELVRKTADFIRKKLSGEGSGHDWLHAERVWKNAKLISAGLECSDTVVELAALLHDIADWKDHGGDAEVGPAQAAGWLKKAGAEDRIIKEVAFIIRHMSFKGALTKEAGLPLEGKIVQDADRLDAIGAIGIARAFTFGGSRGQAIYDPDKKPVIHRSAKEYIKGDTTTINHFSEKLLLLKDRMNTRKSRTLAARRHRFMLKFLQEFRKDCGIPD